MKTEKISKEKWSILLIFAMVIWGTLSPVTRLLMHMPQGLLAFIRTGTAALIVIVYIIATNNSLKIDKKDFPMLIFISILGGYLPPFLFNLGVQNTSAIIGSLLINMNPLFIPLFSLWLLREKIKMSRIIYLLIGFIGVGIISLNKHFEVSLTDKFTYGVMLLIAGAIFVAINTTLSKALVKKYSGLKIGAYFMIIGSACFLIHTFITGELMSISAISLTDLILAIYIGIFPTAITWIIFLSSMHVLTPTESGTFKLLIPVFAGIFSIIFLKEQLTINIIIGALTVMASVYMVQRTNKTESIEL
ncbi:MAG: DMT family transporter [archaeon]